MDGKGTLYEGGEIYEGDFRKDRKEGRGTIKYPDGSRFDGDFKKGVMHGDGKFFTAQGKIKKQVIFEHGQEKVIPVRMSELVEKRRVCMQSSLTNEVYKLNYFKSINQSSAIRRKSPRINFVVFESYDLKSQGHRSSNS